MGTCGREAKERSGGPTQRSLVKGAACSRDKAVDCIKLRVAYDADGGHLTIWFGDPDEADATESVDDLLNVMKSSDGRLLGFETFDVPLGAEIDVETSVYRNGRTANKDAPRQHMKRTVKV